MKVKRNVVMLSTNKKSNLFINNVNGRLLYDNNSTLHEVLSSGKYQHLYITSDEDIKEGDQFLVSETELQKCLSVSTEGKIFSTELDLNDPLGEDYYYYIKEETKKIIATTDTTLTFNDGVYTRYLPTISEGFIKKFIESYNTNDPITEVMVEYEGKSGIILSYGRGIIPPDIHLKVDENNSIIITSIKDTWTREEVIEFTEKLRYYINEGNHSIFEVNQWIEQNL